ERFRVAVRSGFYTDCRYSFSVSRQDTAASLPRIAAQSGQLCRERHLNVYSPIRKAEALESPRGASGANRRVRAGSEPMSNSVTTRSRSTNSARLTRRRSARSNCQRTRIGRTCPQRIVVAGWSRRRRKLLIFWLQRLKTRRREVTSDNMRFQNKTL